MPMKQLTDAFIRNVKTQKVDVQTTYFERLARGCSLALTVGHGGTKSFQVITYRNGKPQWKTLGVYPELSLQKAREAARTYHLTPARFEKQAKSFKQVSEEWFNLHVLAKGLRSQNELRRHLERYVYPEWATRKFTDVRRDDVFALLNHLVKHNGKSQADAVLATVRNIMSWYHNNQDEYYASPIGKRMQRDDSTPRDRIINDDELRTIWAIADDQFGAFIKLCLLTGQRQGKITTMRCSDITDGTWTIPEEKREEGTGGKLKLPDAALQIIAKLPRLVGNQHLFFGRGVGPFNAHAQFKHELDAKLPSMPHWTLHDLRRTARSLMSRAGVLPHIAEQVLGHKLSGVEGIYDRHKYEDEKGAALNKLANLIDLILHPKHDVVQFSQTGSN